MPLNGPFRFDGGHCWTSAPLPGGDNYENGFESSLLLYEEGRPLPLAHAAHDTIRATGLGRYSHWEKTLFFSATDNSDPNTNGRMYEVEFGYTIEQWHRIVLKHLCSLWKLHPQASYYLARGGRDFPPPLFANFSLTNKCSLRCDICGSQKHLHDSEVRRRYMARDKFEAIAETLFPFLVEVELNSEGDALLYPDIDLVLESSSCYCCDIKIQTKGTLFSERTIERLVECSGIVNLSLDAMGPWFGEVRCGGARSPAEWGLLSFLKCRDPCRLIVGLYPTLTRRTLRGIEPILDWSEKNSVDEVAFHRCIPIQNSAEEEPTAAELAAARKRIAKWVGTGAKNMDVSFDGEVLAKSASVAGRRRARHSSPEKRAAAEAFSHGRYFFAPTEADSRRGDPLLICTAPFHYVEIGLEGQINACCRARDMPLGYATSVEAFADSWFGSNYAKIRESLHRTATGPYPLPNCELCVHSFAPKAGKGRRAASYDSGDGVPEALTLSPGARVVLDGVQLEQGHCHIVRLPPGVKDHMYELWEDDRTLGPCNSMHDEIRKVGRGRYSIWGRVLYFSSSDNSDPRRNGRQYSLVRRGANDASERTLGKKAHRATQMERVKTSHM